MAFRTDSESLSESGGKAGAYYGNKKADSTQFGKTHVGLLQRRRSGGKTVIRLRYAECSAIKITNHSLSIIR